MTTPRPRKLACAPCWRLGLGGILSQPLAELSPAERRVWDLLMGRMTLAEIGQTLFLSRETVKSHTASIYRKLNVQSRRQAQDLAETWR